MITVPSETMAPRRAPMIRLTLAIALCASFTPFCSACSAGGGGCGGGGGGMGGGSVSFTEIKPTWTPMYEAQAKATSEHGFMLIALQRRKSPIAIWDEALAAMSAKLPFVRLEDEVMTAFAARWSISATSGVAACDEWGNLLESVSEPLTTVKVKALIQRMPQLKQAIVVGLAMNLKKAQAAADADRVPEALASIAKIQRFTG